MKDNDAERLARLWAGTPDRQEAMVIATESMAQKTCFLVWGLDIDLHKDACSRTDPAGLWMLGHQHSAAADEESLFTDGCARENTYL